MSEFLRSHSQKLALVASVTTLAAVGNSEQSHAGRLPTPAEKTIIDASVAVGNQEWLEQAPEQAMANQLQSPLTYSIASQTEIDAVGTASLGTPSRGLNGLALFATREVILNQDLFKEVPSRTCAVIKHEIGHFVTDSPHHDEDKNSIMYANELEFERIPGMSPGCASLNRKIPMTDQSAIAIHMKRLELRYSMCRTDVGLKKRDTKHRNYICRAIPDYIDAKAEYWKIKMRGNTFFDEQGQAMVSRMQFNSEASQRLWHKNRKAGGVVLKQYYPSPRGLVR